MESVRLLRPRISQVGVGDDDRSLWWHGGSIRGELERAQPPAIIDFSCGSTYSCSRLLAPCSHPEEG
jgi:hypothetical protein